MIERIIFLQGEDAAAALDLLDTEGEAAALDYLADWDNGDGYARCAEPGAGTDDDVYADGDYILTYNVRLGYIGLERRVAE